MFVTSKRGFKAQFTLKTLLEVMLLIVVYSQLYPHLIEPYLNESSELMQNSDPMTQALLSLLPFIIIAVIVIGVIGYNSLSGRRRY